MYKHPPGCRPPQHEGVLLPKILSSEKRVIPRLCTTLHITGLPACLCEPLRIVRIEPSCMPPTWTMDAGVRVSIPVDVCVCDARGQSYAGSAVVETDVCLSRTGCPGWQQRLLILPLIRLLCSQPACGHCFEVQLHLTLDVYLLCFQPHLMRSPAPACPDLPLYPQPQNMSYMSQSCPCR